MKKSSPTSLIVLGSTGSIGLQTLDIVRSRPDAFRVAGLAARHNAALLAAQCAEFLPSACALSAPPDPAPEPSAFAPSRLYTGSEKLLAMIRETDAQLVINGISGAAGLLPSFAALESGKHLALANKETVVMAGPLLLETARNRRLRVIPVDSEHSAVFHLLGDDKRPQLEEIILTASGGAFRDRSVTELATVTPEEAMAHPNWSMGPKITIDSATMANKALEVIEAHYLFRLPPERIKVVIHPQSYVHSLIRTKDGVLYAQLSLPDMRLPILSALTYPAPAEATFGRLDIESCTLEFRPVDPEKYPLVGLGFTALAQKPCGPLVFNAANEVAVEAFLIGEISFLNISRIIASVLEQPREDEIEHIDDVLRVDRWARTRARRVISEIS